MTLMFCSLILNYLDKRLKLRQFKFLQNSWNWIFYWNILFIVLLLHRIMYVCLSTYAKEQQTSSIRKSSGYFSKRFYLVGYTLYRTITIFKRRLYQTTYLKGGCTFAFAPPFFRRKVGAPDHLYPSLDTGLGGDLYIILFLSDAYAVIFRPYSLINIAILFLIYQRTFLVFFFIP